MSTIRDTFQSRFGFILAAAGSAVGLGNIWGFPTQAANNGGGAFLLVYLLVTLFIAFPALYAEIYIGYKNQSNPVNALAKSCRTRFPKVGKTAGFIGLTGAILMLSFYTIVAGWMLAHGLSALATFIGFTELSFWLATPSMLRNLCFTPVFIFLGALIIHQGVNAGIEKWSSRLMPLLLVMLIALIGYILTQHGAIDGLNKYLLPDFTQITEPKLVISAMAQAFFSLSVGVGGMMVYGSYLSPNLPLKKVTKLVGSIAALDAFIAFLAGLLIIPTLYVAQHAGQTVLVDNQLIGEGQLIFEVLPTLFQSMGTIGLGVAFTFFTLLSIAALTSTISVTEVPVSYLIEVKGLSRIKATWCISLLIACTSLLVIIFFNPLFSFVIIALTTIIQPLMCLFYFIVVGWLWKRSNQLHLAAQPNVVTSNIQGKRNRNGDERDDENTRENNGDSKSICAGKHAGMPNGVTLCRHKAKTQLTLLLFSYYLRYLCPLLLTMIFVHVAF